MSLLAIEDICERSHINTMDKNVQTKWLNVPLSLLRPIRFAVPPVVGLQDTSPNSRRLNGSGKLNEGSIVPTLTILSRTEFRNVT